MSTHRQDESTLRDWLYAIEMRGKGLTEWEENFTESIERQLDANGCISPKQEEILERIYAEKTP